MTHEFTKSWTMWPGEVNESPIPDGVKYKLMFRSGYSSGVVDDQDASEWEWIRAGHLGDIVAYMIVEE